MNIYNITKDDLYKNNTNNIDFYEPLNENGIYDENNYSNVRPILKDYLENYKIEQTKDDFNREILLQRKKEQIEIVKNIGEISIVRDPRITKYEDTYSITPYSTFKILDTDETDEDIANSLDHCRGEWVNIDDCDLNKPCKKILQEYIIKNPNYTGSHCKDGRERLRGGDTQMVYCNEFNKCNGNGKCDGQDVCKCNKGYSGPNCDTYH